MGRIVGYDYGVDQGVNRSKKGNYNGFHKSKGDYQKYERGSRAQCYYDRAGVQSGGQIEKNTLRTTLNVMVPNLITP